MSKTQIACLGALIATASALGQQAPAQPAPTQPEFKLNLAENFGYYAFDGGSNLAAFDTSLKLDLSDAFTVGVAVPVYNQGDNTNIGDVSVWGEAVAVESKGNLLGVFHDWSLSVFGGVDIPTETVFASNNVNPFFGAQFNSGIFGVEGLQFGQSVEYTFVGTDAYVPLLGAFTSSDVLNFGTDLSYWFSKELALTADFVQQYYVDSSEYQLLLGPGAKWNVTHSINLSASVLMPISQSVNTSESDYVVTAGVGIEF